MNPPKSVPKKIPSSEVVNLEESLLQFQKRMLDFEWECQDNYLGRHYEANSYSNEAELNGFTSYFKIFQFEEVNNTLLSRNPFFKKEFEKYDTKIFVKYVEKNKRHYEILFIYAKKKEFEIKTKSTNPLALSLEEEMKKIMSQLNKIRSGEPNEKMKLRFQNLYTGETFY